MPNRYRRRRKRGVRRGPTVRKLARQVRAIRSSIEEKNFITAATVTVPVESAAVVASLSSIPQGDTEYTRDGNKVTLKSWRFLGSCEADVLDYISTVRVIVFRWNSADTPVAWRSGSAASGILDDSIAQDVFAPIQQSLLKAKQIGVLMDRCFQVQGSTATNAGGTFAFMPRPKMLRGSRRYRKGINMYYASNATTVAYKNNIYILYFNTEATNQPDLAWQFQMKYTDV